MIVSFNNKAVEDVFNGNKTKVSVKLCPDSIRKIAVRKLDQLDSVSVLDDLKVPPGKRLEKLAAGRKGQYSIRINDQYRICFKWTSAGPVDVEITDYH